MDWLLGLDDAACLDTGQVGAKAAWLARGRQAGLPVLPGLVVPIVCSEPAMEQASRALSERGSGAARMAVTRYRFPPGLQSALTNASVVLGESLVARSSSPLEGSGEWSGAFTSYVGIGAEDLATAVRGCWASAFTVHALERFAAARLDPAAARMAVLIQPALDPEFGGTADIDDEGAVMVTATRGSPARLVQGLDAGVQILVPPDGDFAEGSARDLLGDEWPQRIAEALRAARRVIGATMAEWAVAENDLWLLQMSRPHRPLPRPPVERRAIWTHADAVRLARLVRRFPGPLGEELVLPWLVGTPDVEASPITTALEPGRAFAQARLEAAALTAEAWSLPAAAAMATARDTFRAVRGLAPEGAFDRLRSVRSVSRERASRLLGLIQVVAETLRQRGVISSADLVWHSTSQEIEGFIGGGNLAPGIDRIGFDRWEPFVAGVVMASGRRARGVPAARGEGAGRMCVIRDVARTQHFRPRDVVVAVDPVPHLAPLLWDASGIVTTTGNPGAHLFELARSLGIPAVASCRLEDALGCTLDAAGDAFVAAVDGTEGTVFVDEW